MCYWFDCKRPIEIRYYCWQSNKSILTGTGEMATVPSERIQYLLSHRTVIFRCHAIRLGSQYWGWWPGLGWRLWSLFGFRSDGSKVNRFERRTQNWRVTISIRQWRDRLQCEQQNIFSSVGHTRWWPRFFLLWLTRNSAYISIMH